jgi:hypothetical protein
MNKINKQAEKYANMFEYKEINRNGEEAKMITVFKSNATKELKDSVFAAHADRLPSDWIFDKYNSILDAIGQYDVKSSDDLEENRPEIVDGLVSVYTGELTEWLNSHNENVYYLTEALEEYDEKDGFKALMLAQYKAIDEIFGEVVNLLTK